MSKKIEIDILLHNYDELPISIKYTSHFIDALVDRVFPLNVVGNAPLQAET